MIRWRQISSQADDENHRVCEFCLVLTHDVIQIRADAPRFKISGVVIWITYDVKNVYLAHMGSALMLQIRGIELPCPELMNLASSEIFILEI